MQLLDVSFKPENIYSTVKLMFELQLTLQLVTDTEFSCMFPIISSHQKACKN